MGVFMSQGHSMLTWPKHLFLPLGPEQSLVPGKAQEAAGAPQVCGSVTTLGKWTITGGFGQLVLWFSGAF